MRKTLAIIIAMMLVSVSFASADLFAEGGKAPAQTGATAQIGQGETHSAATPGVQTLPQAQQPNIYLWRGPGTEFKTYTSKDDKAPQGFTFSGAYVLTDINKRLIEYAASDESKELVSISDNKVVFKNLDGTLDISAGDAQRIFSWSGPDKFSYDATKNQLLFEGKPIQTPTTGTQANFLDAQKQPIPDSYVRQLPNGGLLRSDADAKTITIYDQQGKTINTFSQDNWAKWSDNFNAVGDANYVAASYAIKDLGLKPEDVQSAPGEWVIEGGRVYLNNGKVTVKKEQTTEEYTVINGQKQTTMYETIDKTGDITSHFEYNVKQKDGPTQWIITTTKDGKLVTNHYTVKQIGDKSYIQLDTVGGINIVKDPSTGRTQYFDAATGKAATDEQIKKMKDENKEQLQAVDEKGEQVDEAVSKKNENELPREQRERGVFDFVQYYQQYSGMSGWSSLIFDSKFLENWKNSVNNFFCNGILGKATFGMAGGSECVLSKICGKYSDITPSRDGVIYSTPVGGSPRAVAHIEAQKSMPIISPEQTKWVYTVTFGLTNPNEDAISYNVVFSGERQASWWSTAPSLGKGGTASAVGASALIKASSYAYSEVCLTFSPGITSFDGKRTSKICNDITQYGGGATAPYSAITTTESGTTPSAPAGPAQGVNV